MYRALKKAKNFFKKAGTFFPQAPSKYPDAPERGAPLIEKTNFKI
jgi:hypothetical protein